MPTSVNLSGNYLFTELIHLPLSRNSILLTNLTQWFRNCR